MNKSILFTFFVIINLVIILTGCATGATGSGGSPIAAENFPLLDSKLNRGISTKMEVQQLLGTPSGFGAALFPRISDFKLLVSKDESTKIPDIHNYKDNGSYEIWLYQNFEFESQSFSQLILDQKILLVFFSDELYEGYFWYIGHGIADAK